MRFKFCLQGCGGPGKLAAKGLEHPLECFRFYQSPYSQSRLEVNGPISTQSESMYEIIHFRSELIYALHFRPHIPAGRKAQILWPARNWWGGLQPAGERSSPPKIQ